ncbi:uncharacterized protein LOC120348062 isoform X1 [Styela clava]
MVNRLISICTSRGTEVLSNDDTCRNDVIRNGKNIRKTQPDELVVRYSSFEANKFGETDKTSGNSESSRHLKDELGILRLKGGETVTFHCRKRTNQNEDEKTQEIQTSILTNKEREIEKSKLQSNNKPTEINGHKIQTSLSPNKDTKVEKTESQLPYQTNQERKTYEREIQVSEKQQTTRPHHKRPDKERYVTLLRNRMLDVVKEIQRDINSVEKSGTKDTEHFSNSSTKYKIRPHTVGTSEAAEREQTVRPCTHEGIGRELTMTSFRDSLTSHEANELKQLLGEILKKKLREGGWSREGSIRSRDSSQVTALKGSQQSSVTSSKRHNRRKERPSTRCTNTTRSTKADSSAFNERCLELLKDKLKESAAKVVRERHDDVIDAGDTSNITCERGHMKVLYNHENTRPRLRLFALGNSSRNSTADWIMKQNFDHYKQDCDARKNQEKSENSV